MRLAIALLFFCFLCPGVARAQSNGVQVTPVIIEMAHGRTLSSVRMHNWRDQEVSFELGVFRWDQENGEDVLLPTQDLIVAPSVFAIGPGAEQIVRLALRTDSTGDKEQAYRLILRELPGSEGQSGGLRIQLQMSLPIFISPQEIVSGLSLRRGDATGGTTLANTGNTRIRLVGATFGADNQPIDNLPRYLLAGENITLALRPDIQSLNVVYAPSGALVPLTETLNLDAPPAAPRLH